MKIFIGALCGLGILCGVWFVVSEKSPFFINSEESVSIDTGVLGENQQVCDIRDYGAVEGMETLSTDAINAAVAACAESGGGTVLVPEGQWLTGAVKLASNINLFLSEGSELVFSTNLDDYLPVELTRFQGIEFYNYSPLIYVKGAHDVSITGTGKLIGNGDARADWTGAGDFTKAREDLLAAGRDGVPVEERVFGDARPGLRPSFVQFMNCRNVLLEDFTIENGPIWTIHPVYTDGFTARNLTIDTWSGNTDGIVIDSTRNVLIEDTYFSTGDDAISIKSGLDEDGRRVQQPSEHITIRNIVVKKGSSGVSIGSEMSGGVSDVHISDSVFENARHGFRIKSTRSRGGYVRDVVVENVEMNNMHSDVIDFNLQYSSRVQSDVTHYPEITHISLKHIYGANNKRLIINVDGLSRAVMRDISLEDFHFTHAKRSVSLDRARGMHLKNIFIDNMDAPTYEVTQSRDITLENVTCHDGVHPCVLVGGKKTQDISFVNMNIAKNSKYVDIVDGAPYTSLFVE